MVFARAPRARFGAVHTTGAARGVGYVWVTLAEIDAEYEPGSDAALVTGGYATITPLQAVCEAAARLPEFAARSGDG
jgi:broad specificity polyphosphatase/5'/3'-nucleotidase SurE